MTPRHRVTLFVPLRCVNPGTIFAMRAGYRS
jgi:hypothetical protein